MPGRRRMARVQWARETTPGTPVLTATALWRGKASFIEDQQEVERTDEDIGLFGGTDRTAIVKQQAALELADVTATFEQLPYLFAMLYGGPVVGTPDTGAGASGFLYTTSIPTTSVPTLTGRTYTVQAGDDFEAEYIEYTVATKVTITGEVGQTTKVSASLVGRKPNRLASGFAPPAATSLIVPVEDLVTSKGRVYLDAISGTVGTTAVSNQILGFQITFEAMYNFYRTMDSQLYFTQAKLVDKKVSGNLMFEHDTAVSGNGGAKADFRTVTPRLLQIAIPGSPLATPGAQATKALRMNLPIMYTKPSTIQEKDGNDTVTMDFESNYNLVAGTAGSIQIVNEVSTLP